MNEIERKYLARSLPIFEADERLFVEQGYLYVSKRAECRIRETTFVFPRWRITHHFALKIGNGYIRKEYECLIPAWVYEVLRRFVPRFLYKERINVGGWAIDRFQEQLAGLVLAEYEVDHPSDPAPAMPAELELLRDVTDEGTFANKNLSRLTPRGAQALVRGEGL